MHRQEWPSCTGKQVVGVRIPSGDFLLLRLELGRRIPAQVRNKMPKSVENRLLLVPLDSTQCVMKVADDYIGSLIDAHSRRSQLMIRKDVGPQVVPPVNTDNQRINLSTQC